MHLDQLGHLERIYKPNYLLSKDLGLLCYASNPRPNITISPQQLSMRKLPKMWFCKMAYLVMGKGGNSSSTSNMDPLIRKRDWTPGPGHTRTQHRHQYPLLHPQESGTPRESKGRDLRPNHMPHQARKIRRTKQDKISCGWQQSTLPRHRRDSHHQPTHQ